MTEAFHNAHALDHERDVSLLAHDQYIREVSYRERLSFDEQAHLFKRIARHVCQPENAWLAFLATDARARLVEEYQSLVLSIAHRWLPLCTSMELLDVVQEGNIGLLQAIDWVVQREQWEGFAAIAVRAIGWAIWQAYVNRERLVRYPVTVEKDLYHLHVAEQQWTRMLSGAPTVTELAAVMEVSEQRVETLLALRRQARIESVQALTASSIHGEDDYLLFRPLFADGFRDGEKDEEQHQDKLRRMQVLHQAMEMLTPMQQQVMRLRWGLTEGDATEYSQIQVAAKLGITYQGVQKHERLAKARLVQVLQATAPEKVVKKGTFLLLDVVDRDYYTIQEVSRLLGLCTVTVTKYVKLGQLPCEYCPGQVIKYRFPKSAIDALTALIADGEKVV